MHILVTDSGVGGLSVVAYAERFIRERGVAEPLRFTFANAAPANDFGYNAMATKGEKLRTFDRFLRNVAERYAPDSIYVACNTLSVLLPETPYFTNPPLPVHGIVASGAALLARELANDPRSVAILFGTQTTIDAGAYPRLLVDRGVDASRIVGQACPRLADVISEDREGERTRSEIRRWVVAALEQLQRRDAPAVAYLACTHYGYRRDFFAAAFAEAGVRAKVVDPNERAVDDLLGTLAGGTVREVEVEFVTRYAIPAETIETLTYFLRDLAPVTVAALRNFVQVSDLF